MIDESMINKAFDKRRQIYDELSIFEDEQQRIQLSQADFVKGTKGWNDIEMKLAEMKEKHNELHRTFVKANWEIDRLSMLIRSGN